MEWFMIWIFCIIAATMIGNRNGEGGTGFLLGLLFGPFGVIFSLLLKGDRRACPFCAELIKKKAKVCPHCQRDLAAIK